ncbi:hypothetical protein N658DRAFT_226133 [Parathielavia hyrcaniae]|uniref:F-box domain-containing protein n=1 Tax=Parathielavia hyrcaniae TaxID=113614 RepID=A0AAN6SYL7_9PEZI|nr:hypothetical protein N658DRAFT_226133 [Parathielavia hyrcaniae]
MSGLGNFSKFAPELLEHILDGLCLHHIQDLRQPPLYYSKDDFIGLASLCRVSRHFNQLATWRLYHSLVSWRTDSSWQLIARTLIEREDLAKLVKHLSLDPEGLDIPDDPSHFLPNVVAYFEEEVAPSATDAGLHPGSLTSNYENSENYLQDAAVLALMTSLCQNLSTIDFGSTREQGAAFASCPEGSLLSLRHVQVSHYDTEGGFALDQLFPLFEAAPNISLLRLDMIGNVGPPEEGLRLEHLADLELHSCCITAQSLARILSLCPNLRRLQYWSGGMLYRDDQFGPREAVAAVLQHTPHLKEFELNLCQWQSFSNDEFSEDEMYEAKLALENRGIACTIYL